jgi:hypothetical protein
LYKYETGDGITIVFNPEEENGDSSIRCKLDPDSNEIDEGKWHPEKHDVLKTETEHEIQDRCPDRTPFIRLLNSSIIPSFTVILRPKSPTRMILAMAGLVPEHISQVSSRMSLLN